MSEHSRPQRPILLIATAISLLSCTGTQHAERADEVVDVPQGFEADSTPPDAPALQGGWCSDFGVPELEATVDRALEQNLDMRIAWTRLEQVDALAEAADASWWPSIDAQVSAGRARQQTFGITGPTVDEVNNFQASIGAGYEVDLWGRMAATRKAAAFDAAATRADVEAIAMSVAAQTAEAWFDQVAQQQKEDLLLGQIEIAEKYLELTRMRMSQGAATALDVNQQDQQIKNLRAQLEIVRMQRRIAQNRLAVLLGSTSAAEVAVAELPALPALPATGVPAELLENRPDVRSAMLRLEAADARTAAAARAHLPTLRLSASTFLSATELADLVEDIFWSISASIAQNVWDGGRRSAELRRAEAAGEERLYTYAKTVVQAVAEVRNALALEQGQAGFLAQVQSQRENAEIALDLARERYRSGSLDYLRVLTALQSLQQLEQSIVDSERQQISNRIQLCRALGGSWTKELSPAGANDE